MRTVHFSNDKIGTSTWELPPESLELFEQLPLDMQDLLLQALQKHMEAAAATMCAALCLGPYAVPAFQIIATHGFNCSDDLQAFISEISIGDCQGSTH